MHQFLFGPVDNPTFTDRFLAAPVASGRWATFSAECSSWESAVGAAPLPEAILLWPGYTSVPSWVWSAPVPVVALAHDPNLLWHGFRHLLPLADLVLTDAPSAERLRRAGIEHATAANLYGLDRHFMAEIDTPEGERNLDVVFVGNVSPSVQRERGVWLTQLAKLAARFRVRIATGVFDAKYRSLLRQARLVFNHAIRGECNLRAFEGAASGAVLLQEADNAEVRDYLQPDVEYATYTTDTFEAVVEKLLADEPTRRQIADRARERVRAYSFESLIEAAVGVAGPGWDDVRERAAQRLASSRKLSLAGRVWQRASLTGPNADPQLIADLEAVGDRHGVAILVKSPTDAEPHLAESAASGNRVSAVGHASALLSLNQRDAAVAVLRGVLSDLDRKPVLSNAERESVPYPVRFDHLRCDWERAGFDHPDDPDAENIEKVRFLKGRAAAVLGELTGELSAYQLAVELCPQIPAARAALGCALARVNRFGDAVEHLRFAVEHDPFDAPAARALEAALAASGDQVGAAAVREQRRILPKAAPGLVAELDTPQAAASQPTPTPGSPHSPGTRFVSMSAGDFSARFGKPDTKHALSGFTPPHDTTAVLTLLSHLHPRRVLEIGTAAGQMTANLTALTPPDATVFSIGIVAEDSPQSGTASQDHEVPRRDQFAKFLNHFGTAHKAQLITADSRLFDFARLGTLDFVFVDGGHDLATVKSDSMKSYHALRRGGCLVWHDLPSPVAWVEVEKAVAALAFAEPVYRIAGTQVAFLIKEEGSGASANAETAKVAVNWEGEFAAVHSLAGVNRAIGSQLLERGHGLSLIATPSRDPGLTPIELPEPLQDRIGKPLPGAVTVRHQWPPNFTAPAGNGPLVLMQPWEFGCIPQAWIEPILTTVDEVWAYSRSVLRAYVASGIPDDRVALVPLGVDVERFRPGLEPLPLETTKRVKLLFVGGTIPRKGFAVLLNAYQRAFTRGDDVCLVVKDMGTGTFYRDQTAQKMIEQFRANPNAPEIVYLANDLPEDELARLYAACDVLVHPYRGEGFALPVLEAMACGKPVVVTAGGPTDEFVPPPACWRVPAQLRYFADEKVSDQPTAGRPWWLEPDDNTLMTILREVVSNAVEREQRGLAARRAALGWTWARTASVVEDRLRVLRAKTPVRFRRYITPAPQAPSTVSSMEMPQIGRPILSDEPVIVVAKSVPPVPAVAHGKPRVSLTMIVKNEEHNLGDCLSTVRDLVDEVVVVDTGSTDRTREIAKSFGAVMGEFPWIDHFAAARNAALERATGDYAFWMDADDRLDAENRVKLKTLFGNLAGKNDAYVMKCFCVPDKPGAGGTVVDHVRLFRHAPQHRWTFRVHEQILPSLRATGADVRWSDVVVRHVGYVDPKLRRRKLDRDIRLLKIDEQENPNSPFNLFNLGCVYRELGDHKSAIGVLEKSLSLSHPHDSIVRKLYSMLAHSHAQTRDVNRAAQTLQEGRGHYPDDAELLFMAGNLAKDRRQFQEAETMYRQLIDGKEDGNHFASVDAGLRAVRGRHNLAVMLLEQGRFAEAEGVWRAVLVADPYFLPAHLGLGDIYLNTGNAAGIASVIETLRGLGPDGQAEAVVVDARWRLAQKDHVGAASILEAAIKEFPSSVSLRIMLSHV
ncbi:MAG: hypothetical protein C0467_25110, partial [Planctomycetaceae bacterium]|nr:hypothetical protein [Planctomycetaceae bacterium]